MTGEGSCLTCSPPAAASARESCLLLLTRSLLCSWCQARLLPGLQLGILFLAPQGRNFQHLDSNLPASLAAWSCCTFARSPSEGSSLRIIYGWGGGNPAWGAAGTASAPPPSIYSLRKQSHNVMRGRHGSRAGASKVLFPTGSFSFVKRNILPSKKDEDTVLPPPPPTMDAPQVELWEAEAKDGNWICLLYPSPVTSSMGSKGPGPLPWTRNIQSKNQGKDSTEHAQRDLGSLDPLLLGL